MQKPFCTQCLSCAHWIKFPQSSEGQHQSAQVLFWQLGHLCKLGCFPAPGQAARLLCFPICLVLVPMRQVPVHIPCSHSETLPPQANMLYTPDNGALGDSSANQWGGTILAFQELCYSAEEVDLMSFWNMVSIDTNLLRQYFWKWFFLACWIEHG